MNIEQVIFVFGESVFVGLYCILLYFVIQHVFCFSDWNMFLFALGFLKHLFGYFLGIQRFYCYNGYACVSVGNNNKSHEKKKLTLNKITEKIVESTFEGLAFVFLGNFVELAITTNYILVIFMTGVLIHILSECIGLHAEFCKKCINNI